MQLKHGEPRFYMTECDDKFLLNEENPEEQ